MAIEMILVTLDDGAEHVCPHLICDVCDQVLRHDDGYVYWHHDEVARFWFCHQLGPCYRTFQRQHGQMFGRPVRAWLLDIAHSLGGAVLAPRG